MLSKYELSYLKDLRIKATENDTQVFHFPDSKMTVAISKTFAKANTMRVSTALCNDLDDYDFKTGEYLVLKRMDSTMYVTLPAANDLYQFAVRLMY